FLTELPEEIEMLVNLRHLNISGTQLQEIPAQKSLQTLSGFVVSRQKNGLKVGELQKFPSLQGKLCISKLQNIVDPCDASQANMKKKEQIEDLSLDLVLEHLQPSTNLNKLTIKFYGGTWFPNWLGNSSFALPPVGQLHNLKELIIFDIISVKTIGSLPVLKWLYFIECKNLKSFSISEEEEAPQCLTFLQGFYILEWPKVAHIVTFHALLWIRRSSFECVGCSKLFVNHACGVVENLL
ncbi:hypothetical protein S83_071997, partial [Arachis hypogaea]